MSQVPPPPPPAAGPPPASGWDAGAAGPAGPGGAPTNAPTGVAALIFGIVGLTVVPLIGSIVAIVLGYQSRAAARAEPARYHDQLGQVGRVLGWIGVALTLGALLLVVLGFLFFFAVRGSAVPLPV